MWGIMSRRGSSEERDGKVWQEREWGQEKLTPRMFEKSYGNLQFYKLTKPYNKKEPTDALHETLL